MASEQNMGVCGLCGQEFARRGITRHLQTCAPAYFAQNPPTRYSLKPVFLISASGAYAPEYWLYVAVSANAKLTVLDDFLREIWLECCGHMSQFIIKGEYYVVSDGDEEDWEPSPMDFMFWNMPRQHSMNIRLEKVLREGTEFLHEYDFGTTTRLRLKVHSVFQAKFGSEEAVLLARNNPPDIGCQVCREKPAVVVCSSCLWADKMNAWLCRECARKHDCGEEYFLPVVNSPRVGQCGYTGGERVDIDSETELW